MSTSGATAAGLLFRVQVTGHRYPAAPRALKAAELETNIAFLQRLSQDKLQLDRGVVDPGALGNDRLFRDCSKGTGLLTTILSAIGITIAVMIGIWLLGDTIARWTGLLLIVAGAGYMIGGLARGAVMATAGVILWLVGQWIFAYKYHHWKSALARRVFNSRRMRRLDPTRGWAAAVADIS